MGKYVFTALLGLMSLTAAIVGIVYRSNPYIAISLGCLCLAFFVLALIAAAYESIPKPHIIPVGYGTVGEPYSKLLAAGSGLLFENDGEPAYNVAPPKPTRFGTIGDPMLVFDDPGIARLTKEHGVRCFPVTIKDSSGERTGDRADLRMQLAFSGVDFVLVSFQYADSKKPHSLRYTTVCKIELHATGLKVSLVQCKFDWLRLFWDRDR